MSLIGDRYELGQVIGTGGMSEVYAADDTLLGRGVAIKMLRLELARDVNFRERFRREAQNSGRLNHPSIVSVYDTGETMMDGVSVPYIVMERVYGRTLRDIVRQDGPLSPAEAAETLIPVSEALQSSHDSGIIHRDVKPANIMITNTGVVKVMDFGIARAVDDSTSAMTQTSAVIGTAHYLSPEQARGKVADARSDVYALGCVLYESVTGDPPFEGETPFAVAYQHVQEDPTPPSGIIGGLSPTAAVNLDSVVLTAMAKHPADRYQTALEMRADLDRLARNAVTQAARSHVSGQTDEEVPGTAPTMVAPAAAPGAVENVPASAATGAGATGGASTRASGQNRPLTWIAALLAVVALGAGGAFAWDFLSGNGNGIFSQQTVTVPESVGLERTAAVSRLEELGFTVEVNEEPHPEIARGIVIRSSPQPGSQLQAGTTVTLMISSGRQITDVPDVTDLPLEEAAQLLEEVGLQLAQEVTEETSDSVEEGHVIEQTPPAGSQISMGSEVRLTVSTGQEDVRIPVLSGMQLSQAEATLTSLDFVPRVEMLNSMRPNGEVISVPDEGGTAPRGSAVTLQVSNGQLIETPNITRMTRQQALTALRDAGWEAPEGNLRRGEDVDTIVLGDVDRIAVTDPPAGETMRRDSVITARYWEFNLGALTR